MLGLVEAQQLGEGELEAGGDLRRDGERRAGLAALDLGEHRRADAAALGQVAQREAHRLAQRPDRGRRRRDRRRASAVDRATSHHGRTLSRTNVLVTAQVSAAARRLGPDEDLVDADVLRLADRVDDRVGDVLGLEHLADLLAHLLDRLDHHRVLVVALELGVDEARLDAGDADVRVQPSWRSASEKPTTPHLVML